MEKERAWCRHCKKRWTRKHSKGLCWTCFYTKEISSLYESLSPRGKKFKEKDEQKVAKESKKIRLWRQKQSLGITEEVIMEFAPKPLPVPTRELPGTDSKVEVLMQRVEMRQELHHEEDCQYQWWNESPLDPIRFACDCSLAR